MTDTQKKIQAIALMLINDFEKMEMRFVSPLTIKAGFDYLVMKCTGVATNNELRLWVKDDKGNWSEVTDQLLYVEYITGSLDQRLKLLKGLSKVLLAKQKEIIQQQNIN